MKGNTQRRVCPVTLRIEDADARSTRKTAVVFGVASEDSIAWAICQQLAEAGADLFLGYQKRFMSRIFS